MMMAALVCFFGKNNALQPFPVYYFVCYLGIIRFRTQCWIRFLRSTAYNLFCFLFYFLQLIYK